MDCRGLQDGAQQSGAQRGAHGNGQLIHHSFGLHLLSHPKTQLTIGRPREVSTEEGAALEP